jgi:molybdate-binding protein
VEALFSLGEEQLPTADARLVGGAAPAGTPVQLAEIGGTVIARKLGPGHAAVHDLAPADGMLASAATASRAEVSVLSEKAMRTPALVVAGCDPAASAMAAPLAERGVRLLRTEEGSRDALAAIARGEAHVAGCHLLDERTGTYNTPWVKRLVPFACTVIRFAQWRQGLLVARGNPKRIREAADLARSEVHIANRQPGSGSRALLDRWLKASGVSSATVRGYTTSINGHLALAELVAAGFVDAGVGVEAAARAYGLDFVPLGEERYDLVVPNTLLGTRPVQALLETLRRPDLRRQVEALGGYDAAGIGQPV